jgi:hypothetical protein
MRNKLHKQIVTDVLTHMPLSCNTTLEQKEAKAKTKAWMLGRKCVALGNKTATIGNKITTFGKVGKLETSWVWK